MRGLITKGLAGGMNTGGVRGANAGVGNPNPNPTAFFLISNASIVVGLSMDSVSNR